MADETRTDPVTGINVPLAEAHHAGLEKAEREGIEFTGAHDPAEFAPPDAFNMYPDKADDDSKAKAKVVETPAADKPTGSTRARTK
jgi:hypothetical protein